MLSSCHDRDPSWQDGPAYSPRPVIFCSRLSPRSSFSPQPYEQLKALTRGKGITEEALREFIQGLALPEEPKARLLAMTPRSYIGLAAKLARAV